MWTCSACVLFLSLALPSSNSPSPRHPPSFYVKRSPTADFHSFESYVSLLSSFPPDSPLPTTSGSSQPTFIPLRNSTTITSRTPRSRGSRSGNRRSVAKTTTTTPLPTTDYGESSSNSTASNSSSPTTTQAPQLTTITSLPPNLYPLSPPATSTIPPPTTKSSAPSTTTPKKSSPFSRISSFMKEVGRSVKEGFEDVATALDPTLERIMYVEVIEDGVERRDRMVEIRVKGGDRTEANQRKSTAPPKVISCKVYGDERTVQDRIKNPIYALSSQRKESLSPDQMSSLLKKCQDQGTSATDNGGNGSDNDNDTRGQGVFNGIAIYPGTKWCGAGNIADSDDDLGTEKEADACCREHDKCPDSIPAGETKHNLTNKDQYTKSHCDCDHKFHECLREAKSFVGDRIGRLYFNVIQIQCFKLEYPVVNCTSEKGFLLNTIRKSCQHYELDKTQEKRYQFFDPPFYVGQAGPLLNIPVVSSLLEKPVNDFKNQSVNGGVIGNVIAG